MKDAKAKPPKTYNFSTGGTTDVMAVTVLAKTTGTELNMINFNSGGEALTALLGGHVHASLGNPLEFMGHLKSGAIRAIGVFRDNRFALLPDVPTMKEQGINAPPFQMWRGVAIPKGAPAEAAKYWKAQKVAASPQFKAYLERHVASKRLRRCDFVKFLDDQDTLSRPVGRSNSPAMQNRLHRRAPARRLFVALGRSGSGPRSACRRGAPRRSAHAAGYGILLIVAVVVVSSAERRRESGGSIGSRWSCWPSSLPASPGGADGLRSAVFCAAVHVRWLNACPSSFGAGGGGHDRRVVPDLWTWLNVGLLRGRWDCYGDRLPT